MNNPREYRGITWSNNKELSEKLGRFPDYVSWQRRRYYKSYNEIIDQAINDGLGSLREYRGITWFNDKELSKKLGKPMDYLYYHFRHNRTYEDIIDRVLDALEQKKIKEYRGIKWSTDKDLSRKLNKGDEYVVKKIRDGQSYEEIIDYALYTAEYAGKYRGIKWSSDKELSKKLNQSSSYVRYKRRHKISYEDIIDEILDNTNKYRDIKWSTDRELSIKLGKKDKYVSDMISRGYTHEQIIDLSLDGENKKHEYRGITWTYSLDLYKKLEEVYSICKKKNKKTFEEILIDSILDM